ncbi:MAG: hypothetical protein ACOX44_12495 [Limnochordia bacterium]
MIAGSEIATGGDLGSNTYTASGYVRWTPPPSIVPDGYSFNYPFQADLGFTASPDTWLMSIQGSQLGIGNGGQSYWGWKVNGQAEGNRPARNSWNIDTLLSIPIRELRSVNDDEIRLVFTALTPVGMVTYAYTYKLTELDADTVDEMMAQDRKEKYPRAEMEEMNTQAYLQKYEQAQQRIDALALHTEQAQYFKEQAEQTRQELQNTTDPQAAGALAWQLMVLEANHQGELDNAQMVQTGQWVRTRTPYDDYVQLRMVQQSAEAAEEIALRQRIVNGLPKLIALAPEEDQENLRKFVDRNLDVTDTEQMRKLVNAVGNQVQGYWTGVVAEAEYQAAVADERIFWAEMTKMAAGAIVTGGAAPLAAGLGASAQVVAWAPTAVRIAYGGTTGFMEGGPGEALKQSIAWSHQIGYLATEAYDGYNTTMQDGQKGGFTEAAWRTATAYLYGKVFEYGINLSSRALVKVLGKASTTPIFGIGYRPSVQDQFDMADYQQNIERSRALVRQWQDKQFQLAAAASSGVPGAHVAALNQEANQLAAAINANYHAKWILKHQMPINVQKIYNAQIAQVYEGVIPTYITNLRAMGYDTANLRFAPIRNASSGNSVGMDYDLRLIEDTRVTIMKNGKVVSRFEFMQDAQKAWNTSFYTGTGYSAVQSDIHITTLAHPEAFADTALLRNNIDFASIDPGHIQQAGDVFRTKAQMSMTSHQYNSISQVQAVSRDLEKELRSKVLPFVDARIKQEALRGNTTNLLKLQETKQHWTAVYNRVDQIGRQTTDPMEIRRLQQELELLTGKKPAELMNQMAYHFETLGKFYR